MTHWTRPGDLGEALATRAEHPDWLVLAGGTDAMIGARQRPEPPGVLDLFGLAELVGVALDDEGALLIGAATTYAQLLREPLVRERAPLLAAAVREVGAWQIQARGTLGGNVGTCSPVGDTLPVLLALDAEVELASAAGGARRLLFDDFCTGYRSTALGADELITAVRLPATWRAAPDVRQAWRKVGTRRAQSVSKLVFAASARLDDAGRVGAARVGLGALRERPVRGRHAEAALIGGGPDAALAERVAAALDDDVAPIDDVRSEALYRRDTARRLARRFVLSLAGGG